MKPLVLVTFKAKEEDKRIIRDFLSDIAQIIYLRDIDRDKLNKLLPKIKVILTGSGRDLTSELLSKTTNLEFIQTLSAGANNIPFQLLRKGVIVANNAGGNARAVAEFSLALILAALKRIPLRDRYMRKGIWLRRMPHELLSKKIVGIIGFGHVGVELAKMLKALGVKVYGINRSGRSPIEIDFIGKLDSLNYVLSNSDIIVIALPLTKKTRGFFNKDKFKLLKKNVIIINVSRGPVIDAEALYNFLKQNKDAIAALDVWWKYPEDYSKSTYQDFPFHELDNIIMTPHVAGFSPDIRRYVFRNALINIRRFLRGETPRNIVDKHEFM